MRRRTSWQRGEAGSMAIEMLVLTPALIAAIMVIAAGARFVDARGETIDAAYAAARAASLTDTPTQAAAAGQRAAVSAFAARGHECPAPQVSVDTDGLKAGGVVSATVTCQADLSDLAGFGLPGSHMFTATAHVPIETHRELP